MVSMTVSSPQRPAQERHSKSLSPRRPAATDAGGGRRGPASALPCTDARRTKLNSKSIERVRSKGFPRAPQSMTFKAEFSGDEVGRMARATPETRGNGKDGQLQSATYQLSSDDLGPGNSERTWQPEDKRSPEMSIPRGIKGTKRAYDLALKAFQDLAREFDLPSSRRPLSPETTEIECVGGDGRSSRGGSAALKSDHGEEASRAGSMEGGQGAPGNERKGEKVDICPVDRAPGTPADEEREPFMSTRDIPSRQGTGARFCSADACSMRKEVTRRAHLQLSSPQQLGLLTTLGMGAAAAAALDGGGGLGGRGSADRFIPAGSVTSEVPESAELWAAPTQDGLGHVSATSMSDSRDEVEGEPQRRPMSASYFDSKNIFGIYHERDLRERPITSRTEYVRACAELSLSPIPVFDQLLALKDRSESESAEAGEGVADSEGCSATAFGLDLRSYGLGSKRSLALAAFLKTFRVAELRSLNIEDCGVPEAALGTIFQALKEEGRGLRVLDISGNQIKKEATAKLLSELLEQPGSGLVSLRLRSCSLSLAALAILMPPMQDRRSCIKSLSLSRNGFGGAGAGEALAGLVDGNISLAELDLSDNHLGGPQARHSMIIQALAVNSTLRALDLGWNKLCEVKVADALVEALKENRTLTRLELGYGGLGEEACLRLSEVLLGKNCGIRFVRVAGTAIGPFGAQSLLLAIGGVAGGGDSDQPEANQEGGAHDQSTRRVARTATLLTAVGTWAAVADDGSVDRAANASRFDPIAPNGAYTLDLSNALDRHVARRLQQLAYAQSGACWVQSKLNKKVLSFPTENPNLFELPDSGVLEVTFASNRPVVPPAWEDQHVEAAFQKARLRIIGGDGVDELVGVRMAETIMELHRLTVEQGLAMLSSFSSCARATVAAALIRHNPCTEDAEKILDGLDPGEREKVDDVGSTGLFLRWFSSTNPTCRYRLRLGIPCERMAATKLADLNMLERRALQLAGMTDVSQNGDWNNFRNGTLDGKPFVYPPEGGWVPPPQGLLCIDYVSPLHPAYMEGEGGGPSSAMGDQDFQVFLATHVVLEDEPSPLCGEVAEAAIADAFERFDQGGQDPTVAQTLMTKSRGFPRTPNLQQLRDAISEVRARHPQGPGSTPSVAIGANDDSDSLRSKKAHGDGDEDGGGNDKPETSSGGASGDKGKTDGQGDEGEEWVDGIQDDGKGKAGVEQQLDLEHFRRLWRQANTRWHKISDRQRRLPLLRRKSSRIWLSVDQLSRVYMSLKVDKQNPCDPVDAVVFLFRRLVDRENFHRITNMLSDEDVERVGDALGWLNIFNPFRPDGQYRLNLGRPDEKRVAAAVMKLVHVPMDAGKVALSQAFLTGSFGAHAENFVPPKTWKRTLPSSGRWSFKLALESRRTDPMSTPSPSPLEETAAGSSGSNSGTTDNVGDDDGGETETTQQRNQRDTPSNALDQSLLAAEEGETQRQRGSTYDTASAVHNTDAAIESPPTAFETPAAAVDAGAKERDIDNWPGRVVCREVCKEFLSWELEDEDFCVPQEGDKPVDDGFEDTREQREEAAAIRAALMRRQAKLNAVLRGIKTNEEAGMVGAGS
ncbi:unnamed protein product [Scytosiphon promiscuus]